TIDPTVSRMTIVVHGDEFVIEQVMKQLHKLVDVIKVSDLTDDNHVERELVLVRVNAEPQYRAEILRVGDIFRAKVIDVTGVWYTRAAPGEEAKSEALVGPRRRRGIRELVGRGRVAIARAPKRRARKGVDTPKPPGVSEDPRGVGFADKTKRKNIACPP